MYEKNSVIQAALQLVNNVVILDENLATINKQYSNALGKSLSKLGDFEEKKYGHKLSFVEVSLQRVNMEQKQLLEERVLDKADQLYLSVFDYKEGNTQVMLPKQQEKEQRFVEVMAINNFNEAYRDYVNQ